jgi:hypothetical protein
VQILRPDPIHPLRKRLWQSAGALGLVVFVLVAREAIVRNLDRSPVLTVGEDFLPVYAAGELLRQGRAADLYEMQPLATLEREIVAQARLEPLRAYGPFLNPPFFAAIYVPFAALPYRSALSAWVGLNALLLIGSAVLLCRMLPPAANWAARSLACLLLVLPLPFWEAVWYQQNTFLSLFLTSAIVSFWRLPRNQNAKWYWPDPSGIACGLLFYKPQLALAIAIALLVTRGLRALIGLSLVGSVLLFFTLLKMPGTLGAFLHALPPTIHWLRTALPYDWGKQLTTQSFWRLLIQGHRIGETHWLPYTLGIITSAGFAIAMGAAAIRTRNVQKHMPAFAPRIVLERFIGATICTMPPLMPYYMDYDLLLLAVPAALFASEWMNCSASITRSDRFLLAAWIGLFLETYGNPGLGAHLGLNLAVPLIGTISAMSIRRCFREPIATATVGRCDVPALAAAA